MSKNQMKKEQYVTRAEFDEDMDLPQSVTSLEEDVFKHEIQLRRLHST